MWSGGAWIEFMGESMNFKVEKKIVIFNNLWLKFSISFIMNVDKIPQ